MAKSTDDLSRILEELTYGTPSSSTLSPESEAGPSLSNSPDGPPIEKSGPGVAPASPSRARVKAGGSRTRGISGPISFGSSPSAALQQSLENRLRARLDVDGSPEYELTWKHWDMASGPPICALQASPRRISDNGCIGWVSPTATDARRGIKPPRPWDTSVPLTQQVGLILGWPTATTSTKTGGAALCKMGGTRSRERFREAVGNTVLNGALNPDFLSWLMGFPDEWSKSAVTAMPSSRKSRPSS